MVSVLSADTLGSGDSVETAVRECVEVEPAEVEADSDDVLHAEIDCVAVTEEESCGDRLTDPLSNGVSDVSGV